MIRVLIAGEGANELGRFAQEALETERTTGDGVIAALLTKVSVGGWEIRKAVQWASVRKYRANLPGKGDVRTVHALALQARELGCNALVFLRDRDGKIPRERAIQQACAEEHGNGGLRVAGGVPIEMLESWLLSVQGDEKSHLEPHPAAALQSRHGVPEKRTPPWCNWYATPGCWTLPRTPPRSGGGCDASPRR